MSEARRSQAMKSARQMLKYYQQRIVHWHIAMYRLRDLARKGDVSAQKYEGRSRGYGHSDPVSKYFHQMERLKAAERFTLMDVLPVIEEYLTLKNSEREEEREMFLILERHYGEEESIKDIAESLGRTERTMYRRKEELVNRIARRAGESGRKMEESCYND